MNPEIANQVLVEGFSVLSTDWSVLGESNMIILPSKVTVQTVPHDDICGITALHNCQVLRIPIYSVCGFTMSQLLRVDLGREMPSEEKIREAFTAAVEFALSAIGFLKQSRTIYPKMVSQFGRLFLQEFQSQLGKCDTFVLVNCIPEHFEYLVLENVKQVATRIERKFSIPGKCLMWSRTKVINAFSGTPKEKYPLFTVGHFQLANPIERVENGVATKKEILFNPSFMEFKGMIPNIISVLNILTGRGGTDATMDKVLGCLETLEGQLKNCYGMTKVEARLDAILYSYNVCNDSPRKCNKKFVRYFEQHFGQENVQLLDEHDLALFRSQLKGTMSAAVTTLRQLLLSYRLDSNSKDAARINLACVCVMLIDFGAHGTSCMNWQPGQRHLALLWEQLALNDRNKFRNVPGAWTCVPDVAENVSIVNGKIAYTGHLFPLDREYEGLDRELNFEAVDELNDAFYTLRQHSNSPEAQDAIKKIADTTWLALVQFSKSRLFPKSPSDQVTLAKISSEIEFVETDPMTTKEFVSYLLTSANLEQQSIQRIILALRQDLSVNVLMSFEEYFGLYLEDVLYETSLAFLYPCAMGKYICVLVLFKTPQHSFSTLPIENRKKMIWLYQTEWRERNLELSYAPDPTDRLEEAQTMAYGGIKLIQFLDSII